LLHVLTSPQLLTQQTDCIFDLLHLLRLQWAGGYHLLCGYDVWNG
jgi:hypothetical protein